MSANYGKSACFSKPQFIAVDRYRRLLAAKGMRNVSVTVASGQIKINGTPYSLHAVEEMCRQLESRMR